MIARKTLLAAALAAAPLAWAQPVPPPLPGGSAPPPAAEAPAAEPSAAQAPARPPPDLSDLLRTRVEQVRRGNRVSEVRVTGADGDLRYTMDVGESRPPEPRQSSGGSLSTPNFLRIEF